MGTPPVLAGGVNDTLSCLPASGEAVPIVGAPGTVAWIVKSRVTCGAAWKLVLPAWLAEIEQVPGPTVVSASADTVQTLGVEDVKATFKLELAVASNVCVPPWTNGSVPGLLNV